MSWLAVLNGSASDQLEPFEKESVEKANTTKIQELLEYGQTELQVIQRQAQISRLYAAPERSVLEERKARAAASKPAGGPSDTAAPSATS